MSRHLFSSAVLLLLLGLLISHTSVCVYADANTEELPEEFNVFVSEETVVPRAYYQDASEEEPQYTFGVPSLAEVNGTLIAFAQAHCTNCRGNMVHVVERHAPISEWREEEKWETQLVSKGMNLTDSYVFAFNPTTAVKNGTVYFLHKLQEERKRLGNSEWVDTFSAMTMYVGEAASASGNQDSKAIKWRYRGRVFSYIFHELGNNFERHYMSGGGSGIVTANGTIVFPMEVLTTDTRKEISTIVYSTNNGGRWILAKGVETSACSNTAVVEREEGKLLLMTSCKDGVRRVFESDDMGETWSEALGTLSRVWGNSHGRIGYGEQDGFVTATIDGKKVILLTHPEYPKSGSWRHQLHLWLSDGARIYDVGPISNEDRFFGSSSTLLYTEETLFSLYKRAEAGKERLVLAHLDHQLERIKQVLATWNRVDNGFSDICTSLGVDGVCEGANLSVRPVGFLSNKGSSTEWNDQYLCVDATVNGATKVENGFEFHGPNSWAKWPVGEQGQNQRYHFANHEFTFLTRVIVNESKGTASLFGVKLNGTDSTGDRVGLLCDEDNKWVVLNRNGEKLVHDRTCDVNTRYQVSLTLRDGRFSFYVDGESLEFEADGGASLTKEDNEKITHFYFGADDGMNDVHGRVTVKNVFLFNQQLIGTEMKALKRRKSSSRRQPRSSL